METQKENPEYIKIICINTRGIEMGKIILNLAMSLDGFISDDDGGFDWITGHDDPSNDTKDIFKFEEFLKEIDTIVMGSKAYEDAVLTNLDTYSDKEIIVATSRDRDLEKRKNVTFIKGDITKQILTLKEIDEKNIWLFGGAILTDYFIKKDLVDEYVIGIIPTILGSGRKLFKGDNKKINLHLDRVTVSDGTVILVYRRRNSEKI